MRCGNDLNKFVNIMSISLPTKDHDPKEETEVKITQLSATMESEAENKSSPPSSSIGEEASQSLQNSSPLADSTIFTKKLCAVCKDKESRYKCSRCYLPQYVLCQRYPRSIKLIRQSCSIACSNIHKASHSHIRSFSSTRREKYKLTVGLPSHTEMRT